MFFYKIKYMGQHHIVIVAGRHIFAVEAMISALQKWRPAQTLWNDWAPTPHPAAEPCTPSAKRR